MFIGEYSAELDNRTLQLPWPLEDTTAYLWVMFEDAAHGGVPLLRIAPGAQVNDFAQELMDEDIPLLHSGIALLLPGNRIALPHVFTETLGRQTAVSLVGVYDMIEIWPTDVWRKVRDDFCGQLLNESLLDDLLSGL